MLEMTDSSSKSSPLVGPSRIVRSLEELATLGIIDPAEVSSLRPAIETLPLAVSPHLLAQIDLEDPEDPIARQFIPDQREANTQPEENSDPIGDAAFSPCKGIVHRYPDRVLLKPLLMCPVYCRFCFRRDHVGGAKAALSESETTQALDYIREHPAIWEVILTGGDPLMMPLAKLSALIRELSSIPHVACIRIHTRIPITDPDRITPALVQMLQQCEETALYLAIHCNHAQELGPKARKACKMLSRSGIPLLGQTVLLRGVNDTVDVMEELLRALVRNKIKPYYLHHADLARGTSHFRTTIAEGQALMKALRGRISGICMPSYVIDIPGGMGKAPLTLSHWHAAEGQIEDWQEKNHDYPPNFTAPSL